MTMRTFSLNTISGSTQYGKMVWSVINDNIGYFKKFNGDRFLEAMQKTWVSALEHRDDSYGDILPYIKKLARTILSVRSQETAFSVQNDDGEIAPVFSVLQSFIDTDNLDGSGVLKDAFKELYLLDSESFMKLRTLYEYDDVDALVNPKELRIRNTKLQEEFTSLVRNYGSEFTFRALLEFFNDLPRLCSAREPLTKVVTMKAGNYSVIDKIPDTPTIMDTTGNYYYIDKTTLLMDKNPDYFNWDLCGSSLCDVLKIDISPYMGYMYEEVYVDQGVRTKHIEWCGDKYRLTTPGGTVQIGLDREKFLTQVRIELLINLMANSIGSVVALSPDSIFIKPTRAFKFTSIRIKTATNKIIDLPIDLHIRKRVTN